MAVWQAGGGRDATATVLPDGCRDLLFHAPPGAKPSWRITDLDDGAYGVRISAASYFKGYRLRPGTSINTMCLLKAMHGLPPDSPGIADRIAQFTHLDPLVKDALHSLEIQGENGGSVQAAAATLGVGLRRIQRCLKRHTTRSPMRWLALARVRKAAREVAMGRGLGDVAFEFGYADQSHMSREFHRWFGTSPGRLMDNGLPGQINAPGYG